MLTETRQLLLLLVDIVGYSKMPSWKQRASVEHLRATWEALNPLMVHGVYGPPLSPISIGDGFIFCGTDAEQVAEFFMRFIVREVRRQHDLDAGQKYSTRFALHAGECFVLEDSGLILGHPMNELARIASCALGGQILASRRFWMRLRHYHDANPHSLTFSLDDICYDAYWVRFKHDEWIIRDRDLRLEDGSMDDRTVHNLLFPPNSSLNDLTFEIGDSWPPNNSVWYTGDNNYHARFQFSRNNFIFRSDEELFRYHCSKYNEKLMCFAFASQYVRLPFTVEYVTNATTPVSFSELEVTDFQPKEESLISQLAIEGRARRAERPYDDNELLCLRGLDVKLDANRHELILNLGKCNYRHYIASNLAPDWIPKRGLHRVSRCLRDALAQKPGLPELSNPELVNPIGVSAWIISSDRKVIVQKRATAGLHSNVATPSISVSAVADWADALPLPTVGPHGPLPSDKQLKQLLRRNPISVDRAIVRETVEELRIYPQYLLSCKLLGVAREFWRLGKPEFFYLIETEKGYSEIRGLAEQAGCAWEHKGIDRESFQLYGTEPSSWVDQLLERLVTVPYNPITKAGLFFLICFGLGANSPGPLGTGGQTWVLQRNA